MRIAIMPLALVAIAACSQEPDANLPGNMQDDQPFSGIGEDAAISLNGTEPFWGGQIADGLFTYSTPDNMDGTRIAVIRFAGRGGLSFSGELDGAAVDIAITPGQCSDGMSDRSYPFVVTLQIGGEQRNGCGWSDAKPFSGGE